MIQSVKNACHKTTFTIGVDMTQYASIKIEIKLSQTYHIQKIKTAEQQSHVAVLGN